MRCQKDTRGVCGKLVRSEWMLTSCMLPSLQDAIAPEPMVLIN